MTRCTAHAIRREREKKRGTEREREQARMFYIFYHPPHLYPYLHAILSGSLRADWNAIFASSILIERILCVLENFVQFWHSLLLWKNWKILFSVSHHKFSRCCYQKCSPFSHVQLSAFTHRVRFDASKRKKTEKYTQNARTNAPVCLFAETRMLI